MPEAALRVRALRKVYQDVVAVNGVDLEVPPGQCFGLLGPNGAGKTTTIEICEGLTVRDAGEVEVLGMRWETDARALKQRLGIQLQETQLSDKLTVEETVRLFRSFFDKGPTPERVIALVQLEEKRRSRVARSRAARSSGSRWLVLWSAIRRFSFSMSRRPGSTHRRAASFGT